MVSGGGDNAAGDGVNRGATRCGVVGAAVAVAAKVAGNILVGGQRAAEVQRALDGRIAVGLVGSVQCGVQLFGGFIDSLVGLNLCFLQSLLLGLSLGNAGIGLGNVLGKLAGFAVQRGLLGFIVGLGGFQIGLGLLKLCLLLFQLGVLVLQLLANLLILADNLLQRGGKGQQLIQVGCAGKQRNRTAVIQPLHGLHTALEVLPALVIFGLFLVNLLLLLGDFILLVHNVIVQLANLLRQVRNLTKQQGFLLLKLLLEGLRVRLGALGFLQLLVDLFQFGLLLLQLLTQIADTGGGCQRCHNGGQRHGHGNRNAEQERNKLLPF